VCEEEGEGAKSGSQPLEKEREKIMTRRFQRAALTVFIVAGATACVSGAVSTPAFAGQCALGSVYSDCAPGWALTAATYPSTIAPGGRGFIVINVLNIGAAPSEGSVTVTDTLPPGVTGAGGNEGLWNCTSVPGREANSIVTCTNNETNMPQLTGGGGSPTTPELSQTGDRDPKLTIGFSVSGASVAVPNRVSIAGGGAPNSASTEDPIVVGTDPGSFRFTTFDAWFSNANGAIDTQAGSHPYETTFSFNIANGPSRFGDRYPVGGEAKEIDTETPPGFVGDPTVVPQCTRQRLDERSCPRASQVGIIATNVISPVTNGQTVYADVFNMVPPAGVADELGFEIDGIETLINTGPRTGGDYGLTAHALNTPQRAVMAVVLTLWGEPGDPSHNPWRKQGDEIGRCSENSTNEECLSPGTGPPFLTLPTSCSGPQKFTIKANTWENEGTWTAPLTSETHDSNHEPVGFTGCEFLDFDPLISALPDTTKADTPAGLTVEVRPPVGGLSTPEGLSTADIESTTVTLPEGIAINPGQAAGLQACQQEQTGIGTENAPSCPAPSKVGTVKIKTPLLEGSAEKELEGNVYVMQSEPPQLQLLIGVSGDGVNLKLVGIVHLNEATGQLTTTFGEQPEIEAQDSFLKGHLRLPELPFTDFRLSFSGGAQAALATPTHCGTYAAGANFGPWAAPFVASVLSEEARFAITEGTAGAPCPAAGPLPYTPQLDAGSTTDQAGGFTDFSLLLQVPDDQQRTTRLQFKTPEGLLGMISRVPLCTNAQAEANACPEASQIGHTVVASGPGPYPLVVPQPGQPPAPIYLTEGYEGAPYGLSIVVPLNVGPFVLPTQRVRARIEVDELTSQLTVTTSSLPQYVAGVPTDLRSIDAVVDRPGFMFNPTGCTQRPFSGTAYGIEGASAPISSPFQMGSCRSLLFKPNFKVSTSGKTSRTTGASLDAKIIYPTTPLGANQASSQSNISSVKVDLPKQLPSRLTTLQKACTAAQFNSNPAGCPAASVVGHATAVTPVLPVPLNGPAYFVSNGGEAFPNLIVVLQGYGVTIHLIGDTFISKAGITSSTFKQVPDVPIASFDLNLPEGKYSALAANGNLCTSKLVMPTDFVGQNGAEIKQNTPITATGCAKVKALTRAQKLTKAMNACHKQNKKNKGKRETCEKAARKKFGPAKGKKK
jgi:hypothetical protein